MRPSDANKEGNDAIHTQEECLEMLSQLLKLKLLLKYGIKPII
jgi:hypothetical protein